MAVRTAIVLPDAQATPVNHTFSPGEVTAGQATFEDRSASQYIGMNKIVLTLRRPTGPVTDVANRNLKIGIRVETPKLETVSNNTVSGIAPAPTVSYRPVFDLQVTYPERCALQDRKDLRKFMIGLLADPQVIELLESYGLPW